MKKLDFVAAMNTLKVEERQQQNIFNKMKNAEPKWMEQIDASFLSEDFKKAYKEIIHDRLERIENERIITV